MKKIAVTIILILAFLVGQAQMDMAKSQPVGDPEDAGMSSDRLDRLNDQMHEFVDNGQLSGVHTLIYRKGKVVHEDVYGMSDIGQKTPLTDDNMWRIYSMTKPIVSVGLMMLYEEGKFQLNDPLGKYIPGFMEMTVYKEGEGVVPAKNKIRVVDVLRHTTGFGYGWGGGSYVDSVYNSVDKWKMSTTGDFVDWLSETPLYYEPGEGWRYSVSSDVCGRLIEVLSGQPLDEFLKERILDPLGMDDTAFQVQKNKADRFVTNYTTAKDGSGLTVIDHRSFSNYTKDVTHFSGGGGLVSTMQDYLTFSKMLLNKGALNGHRFLSPKTLELMTLDHTAGIEHQGGPIALPDSGHGFGLGFTVTTDLAASGITGSNGSFGWGGAAGTYFRIDPEEDMIYILMIQLMPYNHLQAREKFQTMVYQAIVD